MWGRLEDPQGVGLQDAVEGGEAGVAIVNQILTRQIPVHREVPRLLSHPSPVRSRGAAGQPNSPTTQVDEEEYVEGDQPTQGPNLFGEKVRRPRHLQMGLQELLPGQALAMGS